MWKARGGLLRFFQDATDGTNNTWRTRLQSNNPIIISSRPTGKKNASGGLGFGIFNFRSPDPDLCVTSMGFPENPECMMEVFSFSDGLSFRFWVNVGFPVQCNIGPTSPREKSASNSIIYLPNSENSVTVSGHVDGEIGNQSGDQSTEPRNTARRQKSKLFKNFNIFRLIRLRLGCGCGRVTSRLLPPTPKSVP